MAFSVIVFPAHNEQLETVTGDVMEDVAGSLEQHERRMEYGTAFVTLALEPTHEIDFYTMLTEGDGYGLLSADGTPYRLLIDAEAVPLRSVIAFPVDTGAGYVLRMMYLTRAHSIGRKAPAGYLYYLIPYLGGEAFDVPLAETEAEDATALLTKIAILLSQIPPPDETPDSVEDDAPEPLAPDPEPDPLNPFDPFAPFP